MIYSNSSTNSILVAVEGSRLTVTLNNPAVHNRLSAADIDFLLQVIALVNQDTAIRVVVLTGTGKTFCSGFDLSELDGLAEEAKLPHFDQLTEQWEQLRCPSICALNGGVYGGAIDLALACDFRVMVDSAVLRMPAASIGLHYYPSGIRRYVSRLGMAAAKRLLLSAESVSAEALAALGFADELVPVEMLASCVNERAQVLQDNAPLAVEGMKQAINLYANAQVDDQQVHASFARAIGSVDFKAGVQSVKLKTRPVFKRQ